MPHREELRYFVQRSVLMSGLRHYEHIWLSAVGCLEKQHFANLLKQNQPKLSYNPEEKKKTWVQAGWEEVM